MALTIVREYSNLLEIYTLIQKIYYVYLIFFFHISALTLLKGGADTGFKRVLPEAYEPRLFHVKKGADRKIKCTQVSLKRGNLTSDDVFIIDNGLNIYQVSIKYFLYSFRA